MTEFIGEMRGRYDKVLLDSPPVGSVTDAVVLSKCVDGVLYVLHGGATTREAAAHASALMRDANVRPIGGVLNNVDMAGEAMGYLHYYHYQHYPYYDADGDAMSSPDKGRGKKAVMAAWAGLRKSVLRRRKDDLPKRAA